MTKYDECNYSKKEMDLEEPKAFLTAKKSQQRLIVLTFNSSHWRCFGSRRNHSVANRMLVVVQAVEKWDVSHSGDSPSLCSIAMTRTSEGI